MKATLVFSLPEESEEHKHALNGGRYRAIIDEVYNFLRKECKYNSSISPDMVEAYNNIRNLLTEELREL